MFFSTSDDKKDYELNKSCREIIENLFYIQKDYIATTIEIKRFINKIKKDKIKCVYDFWFAYNMIARVNVKQELYTHAIKNLKISSKYKVEDFYNYTGIWLMGNVYESIGNIKKAIYCYKQCLKYYEYIKLEEYVLYLKFNIAKLESDSHTIEKLIIDYKSVKLTENKSFDKDNILNEMYETLYSIYVKEKNNSKIVSLIHNIENKTLKSKLLKSQKILMVV